MRCPPFHEHGLAQAFVLFPPTPHIVESVMTERKAFYPEKLRSGSNQTSRSRCDLNIWLTSSRCTTHLWLVLCANANIPPDMHLPYLSIVDVRSNWDDRVFLRNCRLACFHLGHHLCPGRFYPSPSPPFILDHERASYQELSR